MKILVVYYSFDGNTRLVAKAIAHTTGADILEIRTDDEPQSKGFAKYLWGGRQVFVRHRPALLPMDKDPQNYDALFIGTPVWAFSPTPAMSAFLETAKINRKRIALFCCSGGAMCKTFMKMKAMLPGNVILGEAHFVEPKRNEEGAVRQAKDWAQQIVHSLTR